MKILIRLFFVLIILISLTGMTSIPSAKPSIFHYVALGDSLTVGYEWGNEIPYGFVDRLYEQSLYHGKSTVGNYGIIGLTSKGLKNQLEAVMQDKAVKLVDLQPGLGSKSPEFLVNPSQVKKDLEIAQLVTITIGGNDFKQLPFQLQGKTTDETRVYVEKGMEPYLQNLQSSLEILYRINPNVRIVVAGPYQPVPPIDPGLYQNLQLASNILKENLQLLVQEFKKQNRSIEISPIGERFTGKELALTHIGELNVHPNQSGYEEMARSFSQVIWGSYQVPLYRDPVAIVLKGKEFVTPAMPRVLQDRVYVPLREYAEALGAKVKWEVATKKVFVSYQGTEIAVQNGSNKLHIGSKVLDLPAPVQLIQAKTYVPLRVMGEGFGLDVVYQGKSRTVYIN